MNLQRVILLMTIITLAFSHEPSSSSNSDQLPRPLILQYPDETRTQQVKEEDQVVLECRSWRVAAKANNLNSWKTLPQECGAYVKDYMKGKGYAFDLERVSKEAAVFVKSVVFGGDGKDVWVFDVDETLLSNLPYYDQVVLECRSWRVAAEANNLNPWKTVPQECGAYVKDYMKGKGYAFDLERVSKEAAVFAKSVMLVGDGKDVWVFDVDETLLSNLPYYALHGYGSGLFDPVEFNKWVDKAVAPGIEASLRLYNEVLRLGFKVFLLTGRSEKQRSVTEENLVNAGFQNWERLILRASGDHGKLATTYKSEKRIEMVKEGYRILGNSGDQWSDLLGSEMSIRSFKLPNPMYYVP